MTANAQFWDDIAEEYSRKPLPNEDSTRRKLDIVRSHMSPKDVIVDIGCGTGTIALDLAFDAARVHGLDISAEMVKIARGKARTRKVRNVEFRQATIPDGLAAFEDESFDGVCAFNILHLVSDQREVLSEIFRILKPGGYFVSSTACLADSLVPYRAIIAVMRWLGKAPYVDVLHKEPLIEALCEAGFTNLSQPDVGARKTTAFVIANRPRASTPFGARLG